MSDFNETDWANECHKLSVRNAELEAHCETLRNDLRDAMEWNWLDDDAPERMRYLDRTPKQALAEIKAQAIEEMLGTSALRTTVAKNYWADTGYWLSKQDIKDYVKRLRE